MKYTLYPNFFFFNDTATTEIYTLSLHDALPILQIRNDFRFKGTFLYFFSIYATSSDLSVIKAISTSDIKSPILDRKSTRLNSSHANISYAVFCLKKKNKHSVDHRTLDYQINT